MLALVAVFLFRASIVVDSPRDAAHTSLDVAKVSHPTDLRGALREDALLVAVQRDGNVWFGSSRIEPDYLAMAIRGRLTEGTERKVYIRADARAKYGTVVAVLQSVRSAGVEDVAFLLDRR